MSERSRIAIEAAHGARELLRGVLVDLQEHALASDPARRVWMLESAEAAAQVMSDLFSLEREAHDDGARALLLGQGMGGLRRMLNALQVPATTDPKLAAMVEQAARAVAILFAASRALGGVPSYPPARMASVRPGPRPPSTRPARAAPRVESQPPQPVWQPEPSIELSRRSRRGSRRVSIDVEVGFATETNFWAGLSMDLSEGGLFIATYRVHPVGTVVMLTFTLPSGHEISATGAVRWVREPASSDVTPGMGIAFTQLNPMDLEAIQAFCQKRLPMYFDEEA